MTQPPDSSHRFLIPIAGILPHPLFTTPPSTRKRKAAEAAIADDQPPPKAATKATHAPSATTSDPRSKPDSLTASSLSIVPGKHTPSSKQGKRDLVTPATTTGSMDSDDDFLSDVSSAGDFLDTQNSDDESLGDGMCCSSDDDVLLLTLLPTNRFR